MIVISWMGLTQYGARCVGAFVKACPEKVKLVQVAAQRFQQGDLAQMTGCEIITVKADDPRSLTEVVGEMPRLFVLAGWSAPAFVRWAKSAKRSGGKVFLSTDEAFVDKSFRQHVRKWRFLLQFNTWIDRVFVCGKGGLKQFVDYYGLPAKKVFTGCYASDPSIFFNGPALIERPKRFIYVGRFDENKNVMRMCRAFLKVHERHPDWELELCGSGPLTVEIGKLAGVPAWDGKTPEKGNGLVLTGFVDNSKLGEKYRASRCFILGSFSDKWGVVVHEAAASGCMLLLSTKVGAHFDFASNENAALFDPASDVELEKGMEKLVTLSDEQLKLAQKTSVDNALRFSPQAYATNLMNAINEI